MSLKKYITLIAVVIALSAGAFFSQKAFLAPQNAPATIRETPRVASSTAPVASTTPTTPKTETPPEETRPTPNVTLSVGSTTYSVYAPSSSSVLDVMNTLTSGTFAFTARNFPGLGAFIESINGKKNADGYYWILYVNGKSSGTGASQTTLKEGDFVEWRYEKSY